ncbi:MAG: hypothetical protein N3I35_03755 [Clostridia bacterium]|nr:hypothetical protein [Clostridia bacterium]
MQKNGYKIPIYRAFGLNIQCELPSAHTFGMACAGQSVPDVTIRVSDVPVDLENVFYKDKFISASSGCILLKIEGIARYLIRDGKEIIIQVEPDAREGDVATFAFGSALGTLLYQRGILAFHGSAVLTPKGAVIFTGEKGAGKSTTAAALNAKGLDFMSDDVCAVYIEDGKPILYPGLSRAKLSIDSYSHIKGYEPAESPLSPVLKKYGVSFGSCMKPSPLHAICVLEAAVDKPAIRKVSGVERLSLLSRHIYRPLIYKLIAPPSLQFSQCSAVSANAIAMRIYRPADYCMMESFLELLLNAVLA